MIFRPVDALHILIERSKQLASHDTFIALVLLDEHAAFSGLFSKKLQKVHFETVSHSENVFISLVFYYDGCKLV